MTICLLGQPYWTARLGASLRGYSAGGTRVCTLAPGAGMTAAAFLQSLQADVLVRIGFRPGASTPRGRLLDACWSALRAANRRARAVYYWIGTDVLQTLRDFRRGSLRSVPFRQAKRDAHLAEAVWLADELKEVGIHADVIRFPVPVLRAATALPLPGRFTVLTHVPDARFQFYGGESIYAAARALPDVQFEVVAGSGSWIPRPLPNLRFHGWQRDMDPWYRRASVVVRIVEHDGLGLTIQEALSFGRHAVYTYVVPHTLQVRFGDARGLESHLRQLSRMHELRLLQPNLPGWEYALREFNEDRDRRALIGYLATLVQRPN